MRPRLGELRSVMHQRIDFTHVVLGRSTFFEEFKHRTPGQGDVAELFHENTKQQPGLDPRPNRSVAVFERSPFDYIQATLAPDYRGHEPISLPPPAKQLHQSFAETVQSRRTPRGYVNEAISADTVSTLLDMAFGITGHIDIGDESKRLRAYPSAGGLYPVEVYPVIRACTDLRPGAYYYAPEAHQLRRLKDLDVESFDECFVDAETISTASMIVVLTAAFWRSKAKYGPRGYRYTLQESGHMAATLALTAITLGLATTPLGGFYDDALNQWLDLDGLDEAVVYPIAVGSPQSGGLDAE